MRAMVLDRPQTPLALRDLPIPEATPERIVVKVEACGICRTDLHVVDGELTEPTLPLVPGHQIVGRNAETGERVGIPWLGSTCGACGHCAAGRENLCDNARFTGYQIDGGFAEYCAVDPRYAFPIPEGYSPLAAAPLLCAGLIGYRAFRMAADAEHIGLYGFGSAAHILIQVATDDGRTVYAFTRPGDTAGQAFASGLGATWSGASDESPPHLLDAAIIFAPVGALVPTALRAVRKGGQVICAGIHMSDIPSFPYADLWGERVIRSVANLTRDDGVEFLKLAPKIPVKTTVHEYALEDANTALDDLRAGRFEGAAVLVM